MAIKRIFVLATLACYFILVSPFCKRTCSSPAQFSGLTGGQISCQQDQDSIAIGDTVNVSVAIPVRIRYKNGGNNDSSTVDLSGASNVITDFHLNILQGTNTQGPAMDSFEIIPIKGTIKVESLAPAAAKEILFVEGSDSFYVKFAIVARAKGVYALAIVDLFQARKDCIDASVSIVYANTDQHLHYLQDIYDGGGPIDPLDQTHSYCFKVY